MPIREFFHLMHIVDDFDEAEAKYQKLMAPQVYAPKHWSDFDKRWASLAVIGPDFVLEIMEPSKLAADLGSPLPKFRSRHGQHLHSMAWLVDSDDMVPMMKEMGEAGIRVIDPYVAMRDADDAAVPNTFFTHPKDTFGQLEFQAAPGHHGDPHLSPTWTGAFWRDEHPLGIERISHITTVVSDLGRARTFYEQLMGAPTFHEETTEDRRSAFVMVGTESIVELAEPTASDSPLRRDLEGHGELPHAMTFQVADLGAVERHLGASGMRIAERSDESMLVEPADVCHARIGFTTRRLPGDPRG
jgi:catechol 2,3-dioxygenase-like lactoylglutathione lyase family enzyme